MIARIFFRARADFRSGWQTLIRFPTDLIAPSAPTLREMGAKNSTKTPFRLHRHGAPQLVGRALGSGATRTNARALKFFLRYYEDHNWIRRVRTQEFRKRLSISAPSRWPSSRTNGARQHAHTERLAWRNIFAPSMAAIALKQKTDPSARGRSSRIRRRPAKPSWSAIPKLTCRPPQRRHSAASVNYGFRHARPRAYPADIYLTGSPDLVPLLRNGRQ